MLIDKHRLLYDYYKDNKDKDIAERIGDRLLQPLRLFVGHTVCVVNGEFQAISTLNKVRKFWIALACILISPILVPLTLVGLAVTALSSTHAETHKAHTAYIQKLNKPEPQFDLNAAKEIFKKADSQKITQTVREAKLPAFTLLLQAAPPEHLYALIAGCDDEKWNMTVDHFLKTEDPLTSFKAIFKAANPNQCVLLWQLLNETEFTDKKAKENLLKGFLIPEIFTHVHVEKFVDHLSLSELYEILTLCPGPFLVRDVFFAMITQKGKFQALIESQLNQGLGFLNDLMMQDEMKKLIEKATSSNKLEGLFAREASDAWRRWNRSSTSREVDLQNLQRAVDPLINYLLYSQTLEGWQTKLPTAFGAILDTFSSPLFLMDEIQSFRDTARQLKFILKEMLLQLNPEAQNAIKQALPMTKEALLNCADRHRLNLLHVIFAVSEEKTWDEQEIQKLLNLGFSKSSQAVHFMIEPLKDSFIQVVKNDQGLRDSLRKWLTPEEQERYLSDK